MTDTPRFAVSPVQGSERIDQNNPANILIDFTVTDLRNDTVVTSTQPSTVWTVATEVAHRELLLRQALAKDDQIQASASALPGITAYLASNPAPITG